MDKSGLIPIGRFAKLGVTAVPDPYWINVASTELFNARVLLTMGEGKVLFDTL